MDFLNSLSLKAISNLFEALNKKMLKFFKKDDFYIFWNLFLL